MNWFLVDALTSSSFVAVLTESILCDNANDVIGTIWPIELSMVADTVKKTQKQKLTHGKI